jgi:hypothetical protein
LEAKCYPEYAGAWVNLGMVELAPGQDRARLAAALADFEKAVAVDPGLNDAGPDDRDIGAAGASVRTFVLVAREDLQIAHEVHVVLSEGAFDLCRSARSRPRISPPLIGELEARQELAGRSPRAG